MYNKPWTDADDELGKKLWEETKDIKVIAERLSRTVESVGNRKRTVWGIKRIPAGTKTNQYFFDTWTPDSAYVFGFILTDGHIRKDKKAVIIVQSHSYGMEHLRKIQNLIGGSLYHCQKDDSHSLNLLGIRICEKLVSLGIPAGAKSRIVSWPVSLPESCERHFVRGVFDGDGCISGSIRDNGSYVYTINVASGSPAFCKELSDILKSRQGVTGSVYSPKGSPNVFYLSYGSEDSKKVLDWCYEGAELYLDRKKSTFETSKKTKEVQRALDAKRLKKNRIIEGYPETPSWYSEFNPALAETIIGMWSDSGDLVLDPCAGWGTRAEAALRLGRKYIGYDVSPRSIERVNEHLNKNWPDKNNWEIVNADGCLLEAANDESVDLVFTCPPYWDLEKYEGDDRQLSSARSYTDFLIRIKEMLVNAYRVLKNDRFIVLVAGSYRRDGKYISFHEDLFPLMRGVGFVPHETDALDTLVKSSFNPIRAGEQRSFSVCREVLCVFQKVFNPSAAPADNTNDLIARVKKYAELQPVFKEPRKLVSTWTKDIDDILIAKYKEFLPVPEIAGILGRSVSGVHKRIKILGLSRDNSVVESRRVAKISQKAEERWKDPERKKNLSDKMKDYWADNENREAQAARITEWHKEKE